MEALTDIVVNGRPLREVTAETFDTLALTNEPPDIFVRQGRLVRVRRDEKQRPFVEELQESQVRHHLARVAEFVRAGDKGQRTLVHPPGAVVADLLAMPSWPGLPGLEALTEVPILRADGSVLDTPGYDRATGLVYVPASGLIIPSIPAEPTAGDAAAAMAVVADLFVDMPFAGRADRANLLALLLTPVIRPAIGGVVPLALVDKPKRGTGATLCVQVVTAIALGSVTELTTAPKDDEEWRKKITSALLAGSTFLWFDNVESKLSSASLAAVLTAPEWKDRILGRSEMTRSLPNRATWAATGNNLQVGGDLGRRCYRIRLDAGVAQPWRRDGFRHPQLLRHVLRHRGELLAAILTVARGWFAAGCPSATVPTLGSFDEWGGTVGGILAYAGVSDFLGNLDEFYETVDEDEVAWGAFLAAWHDCFGAEVVTVSEVRGALDDSNGNLRGALPGDLLEALEAPKGSFAKKFGHALRRRTGAVFGKFKLVRAREDRHANAGRWQVIPAGGFAGFADSFPPSAKKQLGPDGENAGGFAASADSFPPSAEKRSGSDRGNANPRTAEKNPPNPHNPQTEAPGPLDALAKASGFPWIEVGGYGLVGPGKDAWLKFIATAPAEHVKAARAGLQHWQTLTPDERLDLQGGWYGRTQGAA